MWLENCVSQWYVWRWDTSLQGMSLYPYTRHEGVLQIGCRMRCCWEGSPGESPVVLMYLVLITSEGCLNINKANLRDLIAATGLVILLKFYPNHWIFVPCDLEIWWMTLENNRAPLLYYIKLCLSFQIHWWIETEVTVRKRSIRVKIGVFFVLCDLEIWWMTLENNRAPFLYYIKLCASFQIHRCIQIGVTVRKRSIWVKIINFLSRVTLKFDGWPRKTIGHLFYFASSFVHHFTAISELKLRS